MQTTDPTEQRIIARPLGVTDAAAVASYIGGIIAILSQNKTYPGDVATAIKWAIEAKAILNHA